MDPMWEAVSNMDLKQLVGLWFRAWEEGNYHQIPVTEAFRHTSPYGVVDGKAAYLALVEAAEGDFLGFRFDTHNEIYDHGQAAVRYTARKGDISLEVSEWFFGSDEGITEIFSYYNVGEVSYSDLVNANPGPAVGSDPNLEGPELTV